MKKLIRGFTLIELLVTLAIISLIASIAFAGLDKARETSRDAKILSDVAQAQLGLLVYYQENDFTYPVCPPDITGQKETCCIGGTDTCYLNGTEYTENLDDILASGAKPETAGKNLASAIISLPKIGSTRIISIDSEGKKQGEIVYHCPSDNIYEEGTGRKFCGENKYGNKNIYATISFPKSDGTVVVTRPAGDTENVSFTDLTTEAQADSPGGGCISSGDPNVIYNDGTLCDQNADGDNETLCLDDTSPNYQISTVCITSTLPVGYGMCWGDGAGTCGLQNRYGTGPGWHNVIIDGQCVNNQSGTYYNFIQTSTYGTGCGYTSTATGVVTGAPDDVIVDADNPPQETPGCMNPNAENYNSNATVDNGSCTYPPIYGCTDGTAVNYVPEATIDDGSCIPVMEGCLCSVHPGDPLCTEDSSYNTDNPAMCTPDSGVVYGCTDSTIDPNTGTYAATNYNPEATVDDGSCDYGSSVSGVVYGCLCSVHPGDPLCTSDPAYNTDDPSMCTNDSASTALCEDDSATNYGEPSTCIYDSSS